MEALPIDQLPDLCLRRIFAFLSLRDLIKCRTVNRQFKFYADSVKVTQLAVWEHKQYDYYSCRRSKNWFQTDRPIDFNNSIDRNAFKAARSPFKLDQQLKFLYIRWVESASDYEALNGLKQLIHLEVGHLCWSYARPTLVLPNLKVLAIKNRPSVVLRTPKLEVLKCDLLYEVRFEYPETIKHVECENDGEHYGDLPKMKSLEVLRVVLGEYGVLNAIRLSDLTGLKELHLEFDFLTILTAGDNAEERFRSSVFELLHERNALRRDELKLYLKDVLLVDAKQLPLLEVLLREFSIDELYELKFKELDETDELEDRLKEAAEDGFKFLNYRLLRRDSYPEITSMDFNQLMRLNVEISEAFFDRFPRIQKLTVEYEIDRERFEWFLQDATALRALKLIRCGLDQAFIDRLPKLSGRLTHLKIKERPVVDLNFEFILQFQHLKVFETDQPLHSFDLAAAAFRQLTKLKSLRFDISNEFGEGVKIERPSTLEDNYNLWLLEISEDYEGKIETSTKSSRKNLTWSELADLYDSISSDLNDSASSDPEDSASSNAEDSGNSDAEDSISSYLKNSISDFDDSISGDLDDASEEIPTKRARLE